MERITDVEKLVENLIDGIRRGDSESVLATLSSDVTVLAGTDDDEWWQGHDEASRAIQAQVESSDTVDISAGSPRAFGDESWCVFDDRPVVKTPDGQSFTARLTGAARLENGAWRVVQAHMSLGTPNADLGLGNLPV